LLSLLQWPKKDKIQQLPQQLPQQLQQQWDNSTTKKKPTSQFFIYFHS